MVQFILLFSTGIISGFINGLLGTGGGIVLIFALNRILKDKNPKDIFAMTLTVTVVYSIISAFVYFKNGNIDLTGNIVYIVCALCGGFIGAFLLDKLDTNVLKKIFGALCIVAGINMTGIL